MEAKNKSVVVECVRFDPKKDDKPQTKKYEVPFVKGSSVLDALTYIYEEIDPSLGFYASCRRGCCGRCNVKVNGKARLACIEEVKGDVKLEPARADHVIRDLKVEGL
jgi:succinate dehydrogenase/fumarate reductase iron-sulfur protein